MTGFVIWLTGLPGAGKSTIANLLGEKYRSINIPVEIIDGDVFRNQFGQELGFSRKDRNININRMGYMAQMLVRHGIVVLVAAVSPYRESRDHWKKEIKKFVEVYVRCPLDICIRRDPKGLYARALKGEIASFTGISDPYEEPLAPEVILDVHRQTPGQSADIISNFVAGRGYLSHR
ncbi:adenylylsulfate kinase [Desulfocucumis palustris]|uniref:Adenylyl-sulfate kinase n=1 Tax=Desulfocucumis palustris TaxID=1898651 RepID=A0A2L2XB50_9FIRM|nr:adenylyl-sulfate kinase [Desulfocucumis palustris]GBF33418.1 adenylylsulfate kinase [Desulfocucumis palustris]